MSRKPKHPAKSRTKYLTGTALFLMICGGYFISILQKSDINESTERFEQISQGYTTIYQQALNSYIQHLRTIRSLFYATDYVLSEEFSLFARQVIEVYPEIKAIEWVPEIAAEEREAFERRMQNSEFPDFHITELDLKLQTVPAQQRKVYFPAQYIEPLKPNFSLLGHDLASHSDVLELLRKARDTGNPVASAQLNIGKTSKSEDNLVWIILPVYQSRDTPENLHTRHEELNGFILGSFLVGESFNATIKDLDQKNITVQIKDVTDKSNPIDLHNFNTLDGTARASLFDQHKIISYKADIDFSGRKWQLEYRMPALDYSRQQYVLTWIIIIVTLLLVAMVLGYGVRTKAP